MPNIRVCACVNSGKKARKKRCCARFGSSKLTLAKFPSINQVVIGKWLTARQQVVLVVLQFSFYGDSNRIQIRNFDGRHGLAIAWWLDYGENISGAINTRSIQCQPGLPTLVNMLWTAEGVANHWHRWTMDDKIHFYRWCKRWTEQPCFGLWSGHKMFAQNWTTHQEYLH